MKLPPFANANWHHAKCFSGQTLDVPTALAQWLQTHRNTVETAWDKVLRQFFNEHECGMPTNETLRNHGRWLIPHSSQSKGMDHRLFQWRGVIVFEGWTQQGERSDSYVIHPHTAATPKPWDAEAGHRGRVGVGGREG